MKYRSPFFIMSFQRSGSTMLRLMLDRHPQLFVPFETPFLWTYYDKLFQYDDLSSRNNQIRLINDIASEAFARDVCLSSYADEILSSQCRGYNDLMNAIFSTLARRQGKRRWGNKTPGFGSKMDIVCEMFPDCRVIHLVRDGRGVAASLAGISWGSSHIPRVASQWRSETILTHKMGAMLRDRFIEVRYEDLVTDPRRILKAICGFLGETFSEDMLDYADHATQRIPEQSQRWHGNSMRPPIPSQSQNWKSHLSKADQRIFGHIASDALQMFGYDIKDEGLDLRSQARLLYYHVWRRW